MAWNAAYYDAGEQSKQWVFTIFFETQSLADSWCDQLPNVGCFAESYGNAQVELAPTTEAAHIQGFVVLKSNIIKKTLIRRLKQWCGVSIEPWVARMKGTIEQCEKYCTKEESRAPDCEPVIWGVKPLRQQGKRTDLEGAIDALADLPAHLHPQEKMRRLAANKAHHSVIVRHSRGLEALTSLTQQRRVAPALQWRAWQEDLVERLAEEPNDRTIVWVYDPEGKRGKSKLILHFLSRSEAASLEGKLADMIYLYNSERIVFFDIPRGVSTAPEKSGHLYTMGERLKNGVLNSTKYVPVMKIFDAPHVVYMSNSPPPAGVWSQDRLVVYKLLSDDSFEVETPESAAHPPFQAASSSSDGSPISTVATSSENPFEGIIIADSDVE